MAGNSVLLVDDSVSMREMVSFTLKGGGYQVSEAEDGVVALEFAKSNTVDLVITDVNMPNMDGIQLVRQLRELPEYQVHTHTDPKYRNGQRQKKSGQSCRCNGLDRKAI